MKTIQKKNLLLCIMLLAMCPFYPISSMEEPTKKGAQRKRYSLAYIPNAMETLRYARRLTAQKGWNEDAIHMTLILSALEEAAHAKTPQRAYNHVQTALKQLSAIKQMPVAFRKVEREMMEDFADQYKEQAEAEEKEAKAKA